MGQALAALLALFSYTTPKAMFEVKARSPETMIRVAIDQDVVETSDNFKITPLPRTSRKAGTMYVYDFDPSSLNTGSRIFIYTNSDVSGVVSYSQSLVPVPAL